MNIQTTTSKVDKGLTVIAKIMVIAVCGVILFDRFRP